jgi:hypothetical protein
MSPLHLVAKPGFGPGQLAYARGEASPAGTIDGPEIIFSLLDGRQLIVLGRRWQVEVFSVCELHGARYVQLSLSGPEPHLLTLRVASGTDIALLIPRLLTWLMHPKPSGEILDVP